MKMSPRLLFRTLLTTCLGLPIVAAASPIPIVNGSFELPVTGGYGHDAPSGWLLGGSGGGGVWNINASPLGFWSAPAPDGTQVAWLASADQLGSTTLTQVLTSNLEASTLYTLSGFVGHPLGFQTPYTVTLLAGGVPLATHQSTGPVGTFTAFSFEFDSTASALVGQPLSIQMFSFRQTAFDDIRLDATPLPAPAAAGLIGLGGLLVGRRRR